MGALLKFVKSVCVQEAWYWVDDAAVPDGFGGFTYKAPEKIKCRWDDKIQLVRNQNGEEVTSSAEILVIQDVKLGGTLQLLEDPEEEIPTEPTNGYTVLQVAKTPLFRSRNEFVRTVFV